jgi:hypothetical protein
MAVTDPRLGEDLRLADPPPSLAKAMREVPDPDDYYSRVLCKQPSSGKLNRFDPYEVLDGILECVDQLSRDQIITCLELRVHELQALRFRVSALRAYITGMEHARTSL